jgi:hypothetical protein
MSVTLKEQRQLSGIYFRHEVQKGKFDNVCFEDLPEEAQDKILESNSIDYARHMAKSLANALNRIGEQLDISCNPDHK